MSYAEIRQLVENFYDIQKIRIETSGRIVNWIKVNKEAVEKILSHVNLETHGNLANSHSPIETRRKDANSQTLHETHYEDAKSHVLNETQKDVANISQNPLETHVGDANISQREVETHSPDAFLQLLENKEYSDLGKELCAGKFKIDELNNMVWFYNRLYETEKELGKKLDVWSKKMKIREEFLNNVKGIGGIFSSGLIAWLSPIERFDNISKLWAYSGYSPDFFEIECKRKHKVLSTNKWDKCKVRKKDKTCGAKIVRCEKRHGAMKRKKGYLLAVNSRMKSFCWKIWNSFIKYKCYGREVYDESKKYYEQKHDEICRKWVEYGAHTTRNKNGCSRKGHIHNLAGRRTVKQFLAVLWIKWREIEGLSVTKPYSIEVMKHKHYHDPKMWMEEKRVME
jgi:hypothetical protein